MDLCWEKYVEMSKTSSVLSNVFSFGHQLQQIDDGTLPHLFRPSVFSAGTRLLWLATVLGTVTLLAVFLHGDYNLRRERLMAVQDDSGSYAPWSEQIAVECPPDAKIWREAESSSSPMTSVSPSQLGPFWAEFVSLLGDVGALVLSDSLARCLVSLLQPVGTRADCSRVDHADFAVLDSRWHCLDTRSWKQALSALDDRAAVELWATAEHVRVLFASPSANYSALLMRTRHDKDHYATGNSTAEELGTDHDAPHRAWLRVPLAEHNFTVGAANSSNGTSTCRLYTPTDVDRFSWLYARSRLLQCRADVAAQLRARFPQNYVKHVLPDAMIDRAATFRDFLYSHGVSAYLFGGTLLGWRRECGLIPYTTDVDLAAWAAEYSDALERDLIDQRQDFSLYWILGLPSDSLELSVMAQSHKIDLFFLFANEHGNGTWVGGMNVPQRQKLRWVYPPVLDTCQASLLGHLFMVPCNVDQFLQADYGPNWTEPHHNKNFVWYKSHHNIEQNGKWSERDWPKVYRTSFGGG